MTTIILTIIGILLAAAAALMVIFYGGDAFNGGSIGARANTLQNAGTNVISAVQLYKSETGDNSLTGLTTWSDLETRYLKEAPALSGIGAVGAFNAGEYTVTGVEDDVCLKVANNFSSAPLTAVPTAATGKMGCYDNGGVNTFFAAL